MLIKSVQKRIVRKYLKQVYKKYAAITVLRLPSSEQEFTFKIIRIMFQGNIMILEMLKWAKKRYKGKKSRLRLATTALDYWKIRHILEY